MTEPKILTPQEALRALADGKKLTIVGAWGHDQYICLDATKGIVNQNGHRFGETSFRRFSEYTEPKPKRKVAPYYVVHDGTILVSTRCFETDDQAKEYYSGVFTVTRCTALEVEV